MHDIKLAISKCIGEMFVTTSKTKILMLDSGTAGFRSMKENRKCPLLTCSDMSHPVYEGRCSSMSLQNECRADLIPERLVVPDVLLVPAPEGPAAVSVASPKPGGGARIVGSPGSVTEINAKTQLPRVLLYPSNARVDAKW